MAFETEAQFIIDNYLDGRITIDECFESIERNGQMVVDTKIAGLQ